MDSTPPSLRSDPAHLSKSASRLAPMAMDSDLGSEPDQIPHFSVEFAHSTKRRTPSSMPSKLASSRRPAISLPLHDLLLLSPSSPARRSKARLSDRLEAVDDPLPEYIRSRRRCRARTGSNGSIGCASPRNSHRARRRLEVEVREEREIGVPETSRKRHSGRSTMEKLSLVTSTVPCPKESEGADGTLDGVGQLITELIMWKDFAKSFLWFGFGCLCLLSSCFTTRFSFSIFSAASKLGFLFLGFSFLSNTLLHRNNSGKRREKYKLKEDDIVRVARVFLPAINLAISKTTSLFSGEPSMTLKVATFLSIGAEYGHILTVWRLCAICFFASFSVPKLHSLYATQIELKVEQSKSRVMETWQSCSHKKVIVASMATAFWNLSSLRTRIFAAFLALVILRYFRQNSEADLEEEEAIAEEEQEEKLQHALVLAEAIGRFGGRRGHS